MQITSRLLWLSLALALLAFAGSEARAAEPARTGATTLLVKSGDAPAEVARLVKQMSDAGIDVRIETAVSGSEGQEAAAGPSPADAITAFEEGLRLSAGRILELPRLVTDLLAVLQSLPMHLPNLLEIGALLAACIAGGWLGRSALRVVLRRWLDPTGASAEALLSRLRPAMGRAVCDLGGIAAFAMLGHLLPERVLGDSVALVAAGHLVHVLAILALYWTFARFLLEPLTPGGLRLLPIARPEWHQGRFLIYACATAAFFLSVPAAHAIASDAAQAEGWIYLGGTLINLYKLWWLLSAKDDLCQLIRTSAEHVLPAIVARAASILLPWLGIVLPIVLWVTLTIASVSANRDLLARAGALTQLLYFVAPVIAGLGAGAMRELLAGRHAGQPYALATQAVLSGLTGGAVLVAGLYTLMLVWDFAIGLQSPGVVTTLRAVTVTGLAIVIAWALMTYLRAYFDAHAPVPGVARPGEEDEKAGTPQSRMATAMPLIRNFSMGAIFALAGLVALSSLGIDIAPLLAGAGIIGLAISFGSQSLVKDIVAGVFFLADDAFRLGEYIDTGKLKGTVERISVRALQLRHQNGQIHTIPYGQIEAVTNYSRDWITMKFNLRIDRGADLDQVRRIIKRVGQELLADREIAGDFLMPVKMQGVTDIVENAFVVRVKFTTTPLRPTYIHRKALNRIHAALSAANIQFASNTVTVRATTDPNPTESGAASLAGQSGAI